MDNSLLGMSLEKNFAYHEVLTDSDNAVKDIARLLALGVESEEILDGTIIANSATPIKEMCWEVVYPTIDRSQFSDKVEDWHNLLPDEYRLITGAQINKITDTVILKTKTIPKDIKVNNSTAMGVNQDLNKPQLEMYLEIYMPPYLCDSEAEDPLQQRTGYRPLVNDINGIANGATRSARNYHHLFMRIFDKINDTGDGPAENEIDSVTREVTKWNSRSSCWSKLSWYTDFEDKFKAPLVGKEQFGMQMGTVRVPVIGGLTSESKIKLWANVNASRVALGVMGSPNVDFSDNRYLIGCAYIGQIDSFDFSINDTAGNFGLFCTSSTSPAMGKTEVKIRSSVPAMIDENKNVTGGGAEGTGTKLAFQSALQMFNSQTSYELAAMEISDIPYDYTKLNGGSDWGSRYVNPDTIKLYCSFEYQPIAMTYTTKAGNKVRRDIGIAQNVTIKPSKVEVDRKDRKKVKVILTVEDLLKAFVGESEAATAMAGDGISFLYRYFTNGGYYGSEQIANEATVRLNIQYNFSYYTEYTVQTGGVKRDKFGNPVASVLDTTYGKNTANGITDFSMYATFTKDYFQRHFFMFASTEEYMQKELYGKSAYTGEYFADRIKVVHSSEGPRGILSGMITIDTSSLYPFDELIVNKDFEKYKDKPEELYVYLPVTAPYCPFSNSPNGRHGIGILKEIRYKAPSTDAEIVKFAKDELGRKYGYMKLLTKEMYLINASEYGATIEWSYEQFETTEKPLITFKDSESGKIKIAEIKRPDFDKDKKSDPEVKITATITHGDIKDTYVLDANVKTKGMSSSQALNLDITALDLFIPKETKVNIALPTKGENGSDIRWETNNSAVISDTGVVTRPDTDKGDVKVILTAYLKNVKNDIVDSDKRSYEVNVPEWTTAEELQKAAESINWDLIKGKNTDSQAIITDLVLPSETDRHVQLKWNLLKIGSNTASKDDSNNKSKDDTSTIGTFDIATGKVTRPTFTQGPITFQISCDLSKGDVKGQPVTLEPFIMKPLDATPKEIAHAACTLIDNATILKASPNNVDLLNIVESLHLPYHLEGGVASESDISWSLATVDPDESKRVDVLDSTLIKLSVGEGGAYCLATVARPSTTQGNQQIALKATFSVRGTGLDHRYFDLTILKQ